MYTLILSLLLILTFSESILLNHEIIIIICTLLITYLMLSSLASVIKPIFDGYAKTIKTDLLRNLEARRENNYRLLDKGEEIDWSDAETDQYWVLNFYGLRRSPWIFLSTEEDDIIEVTIKRPESDRKLTNMYNYPT